MSSVEAAQSWMKVRKAIRNGPFYTGNTKAKGRSVIVTERATNDGIKRYTDKYLRQRRIGNTMETYQFKAEYLPDELQNAVGMHSSSHKSKEEPQQRVSSLDKALQESAENPHELEEENEEHESQEDLDDELEEFEDDDYNAEKYFDDGDENGIDEDDEEAAY